MIVAGFGFRDQAHADSLQSALRATGYAGAIDACATAHDKAGHPALVALSRQISVPLHAVPPAALQAAQTATRSPISQQARATGSVAEAAALAAAGPGAALIATRHISQDRLATCAIARGADT